jgi:hypothetical protein
MGCSGCIVSSSYNGMRRSRTHHLTLHRAAPRPARGDLALARCSPRGLALVALAGALLLFACQRIAPSGPVAADAPTPSLRQLKAQADELLRRGDYANAVAKYESALQLEPEDIALRFALGSALSHLDRPDETAQHFRWVVRHGRPHSQEVLMARQWLTSADDRNGAPEVLRTAAASDSVSRVKGKTEWPGINPRQRLVPLHVFLEDDASRQVRFARRFRLGEPYEFRNVPPGTYRLIAKVDGTQLWEQKVTVEAGRDALLDLSAANSPLPPDQLPPSAGER